MTEDGKPRRTIRSYVRREGRMTKAQQRALKELWPRYGVNNDDTLLDYVAVFGRDAPVIVEIGFGNGDALYDMAGTHPENNYLGIEVHRPGVGSLLRKLESGGLGNVRVLVADAKDVLTKRIPDSSLAAAHLFFPDPWPKKRHHKRRLLQADFAELVRIKLSLGGYFAIATDWEDYAGHILEVMSQIDGFENTAGPGGYAQRPAFRPFTRFEQRGIKRGHRVRDLIFTRTA